jgi:uncharacterized membrane protein YfcA
MDGFAILGGFGVGTIVSMTSVGSGSLMTPLLLTVPKLDAALAAAGITAEVGVRCAGQRGVASRQPRRVAQRP